MEAASTSSNVLDRDACPDPHDIRLTGTSPHDAPIIKACRIFQTRKDREGRQLLEILRGGQSFDVNAQDMQGYTPIMLACKAANEEARAPIFAAAPCPAQPHRLPCVRRWPAYSWAWRASAWTCRTSAASPRS